MDVIGDNDGRDGAQFDAWILAELSKPAPELGDKDRDYLFSSTYEYAAWAAQVRLRNAQHESESEDPEAQAGCRYHPTPHGRCSLQPSLN